MDNKSYIVVGIKSNDIPRILKEKVYKYEESEEFRELVGIERTIPGLVIGAFKDYTMRCLRSIDNDTTCAQIVNSGLCVLEELCSLKDSNIDNYIQTEFFENLNEPKDEINKLVKMFGENTTSLYREYIRY